MNIEIGQVITQIIAFLLMYWILKTFAWPPFLRILDARKKRIQSEFDKIEEKKENIRKLFQKYEEKEKEFSLQIKMRTEEAIEQGERIAWEIKKDAHTKAADILKQAEKDVKREIAKQRDQIKKEIIALAAMMAEKAAAKMMEKETRDSLTEEFLEKADFYE